MKVSPAVVSVDESVPTVVFALAELLRLLLVSATADGAKPSTTMFLLAPKEFAPPGLAKVMVALLPAASFIVPLFRAKAVVEK